MIPTQIMKNHAPLILGEELDQLLVIIYREFRENHHGLPGRRFQELSAEERMEKFQYWLSRVMEMDNPEMDNPKIQRIFGQELPELRRIWRRVMTPGDDADPGGPGKPALPGNPG